MPSLPSPTIMKLDPNDENIILGIPEDYDPEEQQNQASSTPKKVLLHPYLLTTYWVIETLKFKDKTN